MGERGPSVPTSRGVPSGQHRGWSGRPVGCSGALVAIAAAPDVLAAALEAVAAGPVVPAAAPVVLATGPDALAAARVLLAAAPGALAAGPDEPAAAPGVLAAAHALLAAAPGVLCRYPRPVAGALGHPAAMPYFKSDLIEQSGLPDRTLRNYQERGLIGRSKGHGPSATYTEEDLVRAKVIGRLRAQGEPIDAIAARVAGWTVAKFKRFLSDAGRAEAKRVEQEQRAEAERREPERTDEKPEPSPPALAEPGPRRALPPRRTAIEREARLADGDLPDAPSMKVFPLLTGLGLLVNDDAPRVVRRIAAEIIERYGRGERS